MPPSLPIANATAKVPSTSAWMLLLGLLTLLLFVGRQVQPPTAALPASASSVAARPASRPVAPRATLDHAARHYASASVAFAPSAAL